MYFLRSALDSSASFLVCSVFWIWVYHSILSSLFTMIIRIMQKNREG